MFCWGFLLIIVSFSKFPEKDKFLNYNTWDCSFYKNTELPFKLDPKVFESAKDSFLPVYRSIMLNSWKIKLECFPNWHYGFRNCPERFWINIAAANVLCRAKVISVSYTPIPDLMNTDPAHYYLWTKKTRLEIEINEIFWGKDFVYNITKGKPRVVVRIHSPEFYYSLGEYKIPQEGDEILFPLYLYQTQYKEDFFLSLPFFYFISDPNETKIKNALDNTILTWCLAKHVISIIKENGNLIRIKEGLKAIN
ncbi:MAG: hypothetical protein JXA60_02435 [Candidatus Coatesbacteria bacterium]|nr:hypothetical protein [Candidatus Coatesbacteria bacterium]